MGSTSVVISQGLDWSFPSSTEPSPKIGYFQMTDTVSATAIPDDLSDLINCYGVTFTWASLNPAEDIYDFNNVNVALAAAQADDKCLVARLKSHVVDRKTPWGTGDVPFIPQWVLDKYRPPIFYTYGKAESDEYITVAAPWDTGVAAKYLQFVNEFGAQDFLSHPNFAGLYIHGISSSAGEEMWLNAQAVVNAEDVGMTPLTIAFTYQQRLEAWAVAAGDNTNKLAWVGMNYFKPSEEYDYEYQNVRTFLNSRAAALGMGIRSGGNEQFNNAFSEQWGLIYDPATSSLIIDPDWPYRDYNRFIGGEDEQFIDSAVYDPLFISTIWVEAMIGATHIWLPNPSLNNFIRRNRAILDWYSYRAGLPLEEAPDAAIWLRESYYSDGVNCNTVFNFKLGLFQVYGAGKTTVSTGYYDRSALTGGDFSHDCEKKHYDYLSATTDVASGNTQIAISIDNDFKNSLGELAKIKVMFRDSSTATWQLRTPSYTSAEVQNKNDHSIKTATFTLDARDLSTTFTDGAHFKLVVTNDSDLSVYVIRLIKADAQAGDIDHDGVVDIQDSIQALQILTGMSPTEKVYASSTVNQQKISMADAIYGLQRTATNQ